MDGVSVCDVDEDGKGECFMRRHVTSVKVIYEKGKTVLVEWFDDGMPVRGWLPWNKVNSGVVETRELDWAQPYGLPWEDLIELRATPREMAKSLRNRGIWTIEDIRAQPDATLGAIMATYGLDYQILLKNVQTEVNSNG